MDIIFGIWDILGWILLAQFMDRWGGALVKVAMKHMVP